MAARSVWKVLLVTIFLNFLSITVSVAQSLSDGFQPAPDGSVATLLVQPDGKILVGGAFTTIAGQPRQRLARLDADGSVDNGFAPIALDNPIDAIALQPDGRALISGYFTHVGGAPHQQIARLNTDGTLDGGFNASIDGIAFAMLPLSNGKILIGGGFTMVDGVARAGIVQLNADGSIDPAFSAQTDGVVYTLARTSAGSAGRRRFLHDCERATCQPRTSASRRPIRWRFHGADRRRH